MIENYLKHFPLGQLVPNTVHSVCCNLPTMEHVIGYEEKQTSVMEKVQIGYPRFVLHKYVLQATRHATSKLSLGKQAVFAIVSLSAAKQIEIFAKEKPCSVIEEAGFILVTFPQEEKSCQRVTAFLQHTGLGISSRQAEDYLLSEGEIDTIQQEKVIKEGAENCVLDTLRKYINSPYIGLTNSGMNSFYTVFKAVHTLQKAKGKTVYVMLGWLYLDTQKILQEFLDEEDKVVSCFDVFDKNAIEGLFKKHGDSIAAVVTELPTNPLVQTLDVAHLSELTQGHDVVRIFDPTVSSIANVDLLLWTDVLTTSLTKYAAHCGDVMIGAYALNETSPYCNELKALIPQEIEKPYLRSVQRLAWQIQNMSNVIGLINANTYQLVSYLKGHSSVKRVFWAYDKFSRENYQRIETGLDRPGALITIELNKTIADFFDQVPMVKSPSFGNFFTMMCPFMYLAHYDLVSHEKGRQSLREIGLNPELIRISVGTEAMKDIISAFEIGLSD